jgi:phage gp29-like protein
MVVADVTLYDAWGRPIVKEILTQEIAAPGMAGIRSVWNDSIAAGMTPQQLAAVLIEAAEGNPRAYLTLAEEIEERDLHYGSVIGTRKRAVKRLPATIEAASDDPRDVEIADACREMITRPGSGFKGMLEDAMDGLGKGFSCVEMVWQTTPTRWYPRFVWRDPRFFTVDLVTKSEIRLLDDANTLEGITLPPYKFIVHKPKLKSGVPLRGGLARPVAWAWMFKNFSTRDWAAFLEVFGMPLRIGKYPANTQPNELNILKMAVANLGTDAAAVIPAGMTIDLVERKATGTTNPFKEKADFWDNQVAYLVLGQKGTTGGTPGKLGGEQEKEKVREDIRDSDADQLEETLQRDLIKAFVDLNFGPQKAYPVLRIFEPKPEDTAALVNALKELVPLGLEVEQSVVRDRLNLPDPGEATKDGKPVKLLGPAPSAPAVPAAAPVPALNSEQRPKSPFQDQDAIDGAVDTMTPEDFKALMDPVLKPVFALIGEGAGYEEILPKLAEIFAQMDAGELVKRLGHMMFIAELIGRKSGGEA